MAEAAVSVILVLSIIAKVSDFQGKVFLFFSGIKKSSSERLSGEPSSDSEDWWLSPESYVTKKIIVKIHSNVMQSRNLTIEVNS